MDFSSNYNCPEYSDVVVRLVSTLETSHAGGKRKRGGGGEAKARKRTHGENYRARPAAGSDDDADEAPAGSSRVLYVHRMVLSKSEYFQARNCMRACGAWRRRMCKWRLHGECAAFMCACAWSACDHPLFPSLSVILLDRASREAALAHLHNSPLPSRGELGTCPPSSLAPSPQG
jgi:hypothetical protein